jgi:hypothetical protein
MNQERLPSPALGLIHDEPGSATQSFAMTSAGSGYRPSSCFEKISVSPA